MTQEKKTGNTILHVAANDNIYLIIFKILSKDANKLLQAILRMNWLNETPLFSAIQNKNETMVNMLLTFIKEKAPERLLNYVTHENNFGDTPLFIASYFEPNFLIIDTLIGIITQHESNPYFSIYSHLMHTNHQATSILLFSKNTRFIQYVINIFLKANQDEKLLELLIKQNYDHNTILRKLLYSGDFNMMEQILSICKVINKKKLIKFVLLLNEFGQTILYEVLLFVDNQKACATIVQMLFNIFDEKDDLDCLIRFIIKCHRCFGFLVQFIYQKYSFKIIWQWIKFMANACTPETFLEPIHGVVVQIFLKWFANKQNIFFYDDTLALKYALEDMVKQFEGLNFFKVCNFVGKYKVLQITSFDRFKI